MELIKEIVVNDCKAISVNALYGISKGSKKGERHMYLKEESRAYKDKISNEFGFIFDVIDYNVLVEIKTYYKTKHNRDCDNVIKGILDAITESGFWTDDKLVQEVRARKFIGYGQDKIEIKIYKDM